MKTKDYDGLIKLIKYLEEQGDNFRLEPKENPTSNVEIVKWLIENGAIITSKDEDVE